MKQLCLVASLLTRSSLGSLVFNRDGADARPSPAHRAWQADDLSPSNFPSFTLHGSWAIPSFKRVNNPGLVHYFVFAHPPGDNKLFHFAGATHCSGKRADDWQRLH